MHGHHSVMVFDVRRVASPTVEMSFKTGTNESAEQARQRLKQVYEESTAALGPAPESQHCGTFTDYDRLRRDVDWFYQNKIKQPHRAQSWLARAYVEQQRADGTTLSDDQHDTISKGTCENFGAP